MNLKRGKENGTESRTIQKLENITPSLSLEKGHRNDKNEVEIAYIKRFLFYQYMVV